LEARHRDHTETLRDHIDTLNHTKIHTEFTQKVEKNSGNFSYSIASNIHERGALYIGIQAWAPSKGI